MTLLFSLQPQLQFHPFARQFASESAACILFSNSYYWCIEFVFVKLEFYILNNQAAISVHWHKCWRIWWGKSLKGGFTVKKLSQVVQRIWSGWREDWCLRCMSRTGRGSNQRPTTHPSTAPLPPNSHRIFSHYSGADRWASLCISAMYFLKSEKPIHLGQTHEVEGVK